MTENPKSAWIVGAAILIIGLVFVAMIVFPQEGKETVTYNGYEFKEINGIWQTAWVGDGQEYLIEFRYNPEDVRDIPLTGEVDERWTTNENMFITFDLANESNSDEYTAVAAVEISAKLAGPLQRNVVAACTRNETEACNDRPIITCENTNFPVVYLKQAPETRIILDGNCVTFEGSDDELTRAVDKALFTWLGIIG